MIELKTRSLSMAQTDCSSKTLLVKQRQKRNFQKNCCYSFIMLHQRPQVKTKSSFTSSPMTLFKTENGHNKNENIFKYFYHGYKTVARPIVTIIDS